jgi:hypothetical protein
MHLLFQNGCSLIVVGYQQLTSQYRKCFKSRDAIWCTLTNKSLPEGLARSPVQQAVWDDDENGGTFNF